VATTSRNWNDMRALQGQGNVKSKSDSPRTTIRKRRTKKRNQRREKIERYHMRALQGQGNEESKSDAPRTTIRKRKQRRVIKEKKIECE